MFLILQYEMLVACRVKSSNKISKWFHNNRKKYKFEKKKKVFKTENKLNIKTCFLFQTQNEIKLQRSYLLSMIFLSCFKKQLGGRKIFFVYFKYSIYYIILITIIQIYTDIFI